jgi:hypothetical protein
MCLATGLTDRSAHRPAAGKCMYMEQCGTILYLPTGRRWMDLSHPSPAVLHTPAGQRSSPKHGNKVKHGTPVTEDNRLP